MSADLAYGEVTIEADALGGSLTAETVDERVVTTGPVTFVLNLTLTRYGSRGSLGTRQGIVVIAEPERQLTFEDYIGGFPAGDGCNLPLDASVRGASVGAAVALINAGSPGILTTDDSLLTYSVATVGQPGCLRFYHIDPSVVGIAVPARLSLSAPQANIEGSLDVTLVVSSRQGVLTHADARADATITSGDPAELADFATRFAITAPLDFSGYVGALLSVGVGASVADGPLEAQSGGSARVTGLAPTCADLENADAACTRLVSLFDVHWNDEPLPF
jgi:hypothetical protein